MLTDKTLNEIKTLQEICEREGGFQLKLNFDMLKNRNEHQKEDFFYYEDDKHVGFLGSYHFGSKVELCGMMHPEYRRQRIFTKLLAEALEEAKQRGAQTILLNAPTASESAKAFLKTIPCTFTIAEYQMQWQTNQLLSEDRAVKLRLSSTPEDLEASIQLDIQCFGISESDARAVTRRIHDSNDSQNWIIEAKGQTAGKIRVSEVDGEAWIYGFAIFPTLQRQGIGRKALAQVVNMEAKKGLPVFLEVEAKNAHALKLYESCGFQSYHSQDYYTYLD